MLASVLYSMLMITKEVFSVSVLRNKFFVIFYFLIHFHNPVYEGSKENITVECICETINSTILEIIFATKT